MVAGLLGAGLLSQSAPARAVGPDAVSVPGSGVTSWVMQPVRLVGSGLESVGSGVAAVWRAAVDLVSPARPIDSLPDQISEDDHRFFGVLDALGLRLSKVEVGGTWISSASYRFVAAREPSIADLERAERQLDSYRSAAGGPFARAKQRIARSVLDLAGSKDFVLTAAVVELSPWPSASYEISAHNGPPEASERRIAESVRSR
jgi:hypothetical protein